MKFGKHDERQLQLAMPQLEDEPARKKAREPLQVLKRNPSGVRARKSKERKLDTVKALSTSQQRPATNEWTVVRSAGNARRQHLSSRTTFVHADAAHWMASLPENSIQAIVTDPPYGVVEYNGVNQAKLRSGKGGVWRIPPSFDGARRSPLPRFTVLSSDDRAELVAFFVALSKDLIRVLVPGGHVFIASNPLLSSQTFCAFESVGFEKRGEVIRLVQTLRGGDRPKNADKEFPEVSMMARSCWEPWGIFRKPLDGTAAHNLRKWRAGGLRRISDAEPFKDVIPCSPTRGVEKRMAPHPSLKPQRFMRQIVRASLPLGEGIVYDPFAGSGSTLAAAEALGYVAIGTERDEEFFEMGCKAFKALCRPSIS
jgi:site-specific DNA-methyltransferase (adenine-specific)